MLKNILYFLAHPKIEDSPHSVDIKKVILDIGKLILIYYAFVIVNKYATPQK